MCALPHISVAPPAEPSPNTTLTADQAVTENGGITASGHVRIEKGGQALEAPWAHYNPQTQTANLKQGGTLSQSGMAIQTQKANINMQDLAGQLNDVRYIFFGNGGRGIAQKANVQDKQHASFQRATYTTCAGPNPAWQLYGSHIDLNRESGRGQSFNTLLTLYNIPVFYTPYFNFPIDDRRHTGLLFPVFRQSSKVGNDYAIPIYFNLAPNYDMTIVPHYLTKRGYQFDGQFRYLTEHHQGTLGGSFLPSDKRRNDESREFYEFKHQGKLAPHLGLKARYAHAGDDDIFDDLSSDLTQTSTKLLERSAQLNYENSFAKFSILGQSFQRLYTVTGAPNYPFTADPYERLPQIRFDLTSPTAPFSLGIENEYTAFKSNAGIDTQRLDVRPHINWGVDHGGWYANAELADRYTHYDFGDNHTQPKNGPEDETWSRNIPYFNLTTGLRFNREFDNGWQQTLEPQLSYTYRKYKNQDQLPLFDTGIPNLYYDRLFTGKRYTGKDRISDANQVAVGVRSQLINDQGRTVLDMSLGRAISFTKPKVGWPKQVPTGYSEHGSNYVSELNYFPTENWHLGLGGEYDPDNKEFNRAMAQIGFHNDAGYRLNLSWHRYDDYRLLQKTNSDGDVNFIGGETESLKQTVVDFAVPLTDSIKLVNRWNYSLEQGQTIEYLAGVELQPSCCWAARISWRRYIAYRDGDYDKAVMFQFILTGLGSFGKNAESAVTGDIFN